MLPNVVIVMAQCSKRQHLFGIRFEQVGRNWAADWTFALKEGVAKREGYDKATIRGSFGTTEQYPGCPFCETISVAQCSRCGQISCLQSGETLFACPKCGLHGRIGGEITSMNAGADR